MNTAHFEDTYSASLRHPTSGISPSPTGGYLSLLRRLPGVSRTVASGCIILMALAGLSGCAVEPETMSAVPAPPVREDGLNIAVWPVFNQSATPAPLDKINRLLVNNLRQRSINLLDETILESVIARNRIRYLGGLDRLTARAFHKEAGVQAVLITSLELYSEVSPPKIALTARLVSSSTSSSRAAWARGPGHPRPTKSGSTTWFPSPGKLSWVIEYVMFRFPRT